MMGHPKLAAACALGLAIAACGGNAVDNAANEAGADGEDVDNVVETVTEAVRVTIVRMGGEQAVRSVTGGFARCTVNGTQKGSQPKS